MAGRGKGFRIFANIIMVLLAVMCLLPFVLLLVSSLTKESTITAKGYSFLIRDLDFSAYRYLFASGDSILRAYGMTFAYLLSKKDLPGRNLLSFYVFFTMLFSGGMIPSYIIWSQVFKVSETIFGLLLPNLLMNAFNIILMRTFLTSNIPQEILEAAEMDSCSQVRMLFDICIPLSKPMISTVTLFSALGYWNDWVNGLYYLIRNKKLYTIQNVLNTMQNNIQFLKQNSQAASTSLASTVPSLGLRMAIAVVSVLPILMIYPFFQKQFVQGIVIGGVKG